MEKALVAAEGKLTDAFFAFHVCFCTAGIFVVENSTDVQLGANIAIADIHAETAAASKIDHQQFIDYLEAISQSDQRIIDALRSKSHRLEETLMALMKVFGLLGFILFCVSMTVLAPSNAQAQF